MKTMTRKSKLKKTAARQAPFPEKIPNWIGGRETPARSGKWFDKVNPADGRRLCRASRSEKQDISEAVGAAKLAQASWAGLTPVKRGQILNEVTLSLKKHRETIAQIVHLETGKSLKDALGETDAAIQQGFFMAGEGQRLYGKTLTSGVAHKQVMTLRQPLGVAGLIVAANTPIANVAWKVFPALISGNTAILKPAEEAPATAWIFGKASQEAGLPPGVLNIVQGLGEESGRPLVSSPDVNVISFTGSSQVGLEIARAVSERMVKVSLELGGKNPFVVCDDADLELAVQWATLSAFSNAGQRCASASRIIVFKSVYEHFLSLLVEKVNTLRVGTRDEDDFGPVISEKALDQMLRAVEEAGRRGAKILAGGHRLLDGLHRKGFYIAPTLIENAGPEDPISTQELFGPITCLYPAHDFNEALALANNSPYGLTASVHTRTLDRALEFAKRVEAGSVIVNGGTYGSEPHMPFGGVKLSGNGTREPGVEALDIYTQLKTISTLSRPDRV